MATAWLQHGYSMAKSTASSIANSNFMANHPLQRNRIMAHKKSDRTSYQESDCNRVKASGSVSMLTKVLLHRRRY